MPSAKRGRELIERYRRRTSTAASLPELPMLGPDAVSEVKPDAEFELDYWWIDIRIRVFGLVALILTDAFCFQVVTNHGVHDLLRLLAAVAGILIALGSVVYVWRWIVPPTWKQRR